MVDKSQWQVHFIRDEGFTDQARTESGGRDQSRSSIAGLASNLITIGPTMKTIERIRRQKMIQTAEGYLDLTMAFDDLWPLELPYRVTLADRALEALQQIKRPMGHKPYILFLKGQAARAAERYPEAVNYLEQSRRLDPDNVHVWLALAWCYKRINRIDLAIESMETAEVLEPENAIVQYNLACYWALARDAHNAVQHLAHAFELNPEFREFVDQESDFDPIRDDAEFLALTSAPV